MVSPGVFKHDGLFYYTTLSGYSGSVPVELFFKMRGKRHGLYWRTYQSMEEALADYRRAARTRPNFVVDVFEGGGDG